MVSLCTFNTFFTHTCYCTGCELMGSIAVFILTERCASIQICKRTLTHTDMHTYHTCAHKHACMHAHTRTHAHTHTHTYTRAHMHVHTHTHIHTHPHTHTCARAHTHTDTHPHPHVHTHTLTHTDTHTHIHTLVPMCTRTHTHTLSLSPSLCVCLSTPPSPPTSMQTCVIPDSSGRTRDHGSGALRAVVAGDTRPVVRV